MARKKKRARRRGRGLAIMGSVVLLGTCLGWLLSSGERQDPVLPPPVLPIPARTELTAEDAARWMDAKLHEIWTRLELSGRQISREELFNREWNGEKWETRVFHVRLPKGVSGAAAAEELAGLARETSRSVQVVWVTEGIGLRGADLWVEGHLTHRVVLREAPEEPKSPPAPGLTPPQIAVIVDDLGQQYAPFQSLVEMGTPLTLAVFPRMAQSRRIVLEATARGMEVIVHLPMEPRGYPEKKPGAGALLVSMSVPEVEQALKENLEDIPQAKGVNNHMGSRFTEDRERMERVMEALASRGLYFVDSLTSPRSTGFPAARQAGLRAFRRDVFLDSVQEEARIRDQFQLLMQVARAQGYAIGICHPYPETLRLLPELHRHSVAQGFQWVTVSELRVPQGKTDRDLTVQRDPQRPAP